MHDDVTQVEDGAVDIEDDTKLVSRVPASVLLVVLGQGTHPPRRLGWGWTGSG